MGLAIIAHAQLGDYDQSGWLGAKIVALVVGGFCLISPLKPPKPFAPNHLWLWSMACLLFGLSKVYTLLVLRDVLTQSLLLGSYSIIASWLFLHPRSYQIALRSVSLLTALTYALAILHKLNADFFFDQSSCAVHGFEISVSLIPQGFLTEHIHLLITFLRGKPHIAATIVIAFEFSLCLLCLRRSPWVWLIGAIFHIPLTLTIAPAFGSVMAVGWGAGALFNLSRSRHRLVSDHSRQRVVLKPIGDRKSDIRSSAFPMMVVICYGVHGALSPYIGLEVQHSAAMLSNLRVDPKCSNSFVFPPLADDPYLYINDMEFGVIKSARLERRRERVLQGLWSLSALSTMQKNWCIPEQRPLRLSGEYRGEMFVISDLCDEGSLDSLYENSPSPRLEGWQRFQKNLGRECHQACVH